MATDISDQSSSDISLEEVKGSLIRWWRKKVVAAINQGMVVTKVREESEFSARYVFMISMSAGIAILGLLLSSPAVVIGAMLLSPLMGPIIGAGFALAIGDARWLRDCGRTLLIGTVIAILFCALIVLFSPLQTVTEEIAARTRPNLFDLGVALFSALAGAYAMIKGREGTIVGVAIATALMPPLAVVGFGLATANWTVFGGALMLFVTNLMTIAFSAAVMARLYGFGTSLSARQSWVQSIAIFAVFILLAVPLGISLRQIAWEANASRLINGFIKDEFDPKARISELDIDFGADAIKIDASILTPDYRRQAVAHSERSLSRMLNMPVSVSINQYRVGTGAGDAEAAQLAAVRAKERAAASEQAISELGSRLALVAGVGVSEVLLDRENRRAVVKARPIPDSSLSVYRELERRVMAWAPDWRIELHPPAGQLPDIEVEDGRPTQAGEGALRLIGWAVTRIDAPIGLNGQPDDVEAIRTLLASRGFRAAADKTLPKKNGLVTIGWLAPDDAPLDNEGDKAAQQ